MINARADVQSDPYDENLVKIQCARTQCWAREGGDTSPQHRAPSLADLREDFSCGPGPCDATSRGPHIVLVL